MCFFHVGYIIISMNVNSFTGARPHARHGQIRPHASRHDSRHTQCGNPLHANPSPSPSRNSLRDTMHNPGSNNMGRNSSML